MTEYTATATLPLNEPIALTLPEVRDDLFMFPYESGQFKAMPSTTPPPGTTFDYQGLNGTPTAAGDYVLKMAVLDGYGQVKDSYNGTLTIAAPAPTEVTPAPPTFTEEDYVIPETAGVAYQVNGTATSAGTYPATAGGTVTVTATAEEGYVIVGPSTWTHTYGPPEPDPAAEVAALAAELAPAVAAFVAKPAHARTVSTAEAALPVVIEFVRGYTRGREWVGYVPPYPLRSVIVSAAARLVTNPRQVRQYGIADYSETPAVLNGYTLAELGVLRRYRRVQA